MTRTGYAKPTGVSTPSRPLQPPPDTWMIPGIHHPLPGFGRLQGFSQIPTPAGNRRRLLRFRPFQRHHRPTCRTRCPTVPLIAHRFSQPPGDPDVRNDLRVCSTPLALLGSWPPEFEPTTDRELFPVLPASSLLPALHGLLPDDTDISQTSNHNGLTRTRSSYHPAPRPASGTGFHHGLGPTLKL